MAAVAQSPPSTTLDLARGMRIAKKGWKPCHILYQHLASSSRQPFRAETAAAAAENTSYDVLKQKREL